MSGITHGIKFPIHSTLPKYENCAQGKLVKKPFSANPKRAREILDSIHSDLCQVNNPSLSDAKYFMTLVDDSSRKVFVSRAKFSCLTGEVLTFNSDPTFIE